MTADALDVRALAQRAAEAGAPDAKVREATRLRVLDLIGCACAGYRIGTWRSLARALDAPGPAHSWFEGAERATADALRVNVFMSHAAYMEDGSRSTGGHPSCVVTPTALTVAGGLRAALPRPDDLLAAVASGYEVFLRVGERAYPAIVDRGFQSTAVLAPLASAAATARLLRLPETETMHALAIAASLGAGLKAALRASATQPLQVAQGCEAGRVAALMAAAGARGHESILAEGFFPAYANGERVVPEPSVPRMLGTYVKMHGGCRGNHAPLDAFLALSRQHPAPAADLRSVSVHVDRYTLAAEIEHPATPAQAQFSIAFAIAVAAVHGETSAFAFTQRRLEDPRVRALMARIAVLYDPALDAGYPAKRASRVAIETASGVHTLSLDYPAGEPENPVAPEALCRKYDELAGPVLGDDTDRVRDFVLDLERQPTLAPLLDALERRRAHAWTGTGPKHDQAVAG
ncbi:2-methylcitrate dehydratase [Burkholderiales bacterium]|nr:2-methylcitrate dehydratase [Burkholderiales bacterium]